MLDGNPCPQCYAIALQAGEIRNFLSSLVLGVWSLVLPSFASLMEGRAPRARIATLRRSARDKRAPIPQSEIPARNATP